MRRDDLRLAANVNSTSRPKPIYSFDSDFQFLSIQPERQLKREGCLSLAVNVNRTTGLPDGKILSIWHYQGIAYCRSFHGD